MLYNKMCKPSWVKIAAYGLSLQVERKGIELLHKHLTMSSAVAERPPVVWSTPLGLPVLPDVYSRNSGSSEFIHSTCITQLHVTNASYKFDTAMLRITDIRIVHTALSCRK